MSDAIKGKPPFTMPMPVEVQCAGHPDYSTHEAYFKMQDSTTDVTDDDGNDIGRIAGGMGAFCFHHKKSGTYWVIRHDVAWHAFEEALKKWLASPESSERPPGRRDDEEEAKEGPEEG